MSHAKLTIRRARHTDLPALGRLGALLLRMHYEFDHRRFLAPRPDSEEGHAWFLGTRLDNDDSVMLVAEREGHVVGYAYAGVEALSWKELRDEAGFIHDVYVDAEARSGGVATALLQEATRWLSRRRVPRVILWTAAANAGAQRLFEGLGFRHTMREMTKEM